MIAATPDLVTGAHDASAGTGRWRVSCDASKTSSRLRAIGDRRAAARRDRRPAAAGPRRARIDRLRPAPDALADVLRRDGGGTRRPPPLHDDDGVDPGAMRGARPT